MEQEPETAKSILKKPREPEPEHGSENKSKEVLKRIESILRSRVTYEHYNTLDERNRYSISGRPSVNMSRTKTVNDDNHKNLGQKAEE